MYGTMSPWTCKPAWVCGFVPMIFTQHPGRNPKLPQAGPGSPDWAHLILLRGGAEIQAKKPPLGEFPKQILSLGSPHRNGKAPGGFPSACLEEDPQQHCSQGEGHGSQGVTSAGH